MNKIDLNQYKKKIYTQDGEDGMIEKIFQVLGIKKGWYCEFGAGDGSAISNTRKLREEGWNGVLIEGSEDLFKRMVGYLGNDETVTLINSYISCNPDECVDYLLSKTEIPSDFDLLSIDIDGNDLWIWKSIIKYKPKVVIVEYNSTYPSAESLTIEYNRDHRFGDNDYYGATPGAFDKLATEKGYTLVGSTDGLNLLYCRNDLSSPFKSYKPGDIHSGRYHKPSGISMIPY